MNNLCVSRVLASIPTEREREREEQVGGGNGCEENSSSS